MPPNERMTLLSNKWLHERNFWIAALAFISWTLLARLLALVQEGAELRDQKRALEWRLAQATIKVGKLQGDVTAAAAAVVGGKAAATDSKAADSAPSAPPAQPGDELPGKRKAA